MSAGQCSHHKYFEVFVSASKESLYKIGLPTYFGKCAAEENMKKLYNIDSLMGLLLYLSRFDNVGIVQKKINS